MNSILNVILPIKSKLTFPIRSLSRINRFEHISNNFLFCFSNSQSPQKAQGWRSIIILIISIIVNNLPSNINTTLKLS